MKINHPVTDHEVIMKPGTILVTRTNLKGVITYANDAFIEISGFSKDELIGANHNVVRHPDMPPEAFADLWKTIQSGKPWVKLVKNRCKSGDYYWVEANVAPIVEKGQTSGYLSVRYSPTREQIRDAEILYDKVRNKQLKIGVESRLGRFNFVNRLGLAGKLGFLAVLFLLPTILLFGLFNIEKNLSIEFASKEVRGAQYLNKLHDLSVKLAEYRQVSTSPNLDAISQNKALSENKVSETLKELNVQGANDLDFFQVSEQWSKIQAAWSDMQGKDFHSQFSLSSKMLEEINKMVVKVADNSNLTLDPDVDSYYLMAASTTALPELLNNVGRLQSLAIKISNSGGSLDSNEKIDLALLMNEISRDSETVRNSIQSAVKENSVLQASLGSHQDELQQNIFSFVNSLTQDIRNAQNLSGSSEQIYEKGNLAIRSINRLYDVISVELLDLLQKRIDGFEKDRFYKLTILLIILVIVIYLGYRIIRYITISISDVNQVLDRIGQGDFRNHIDLNGSDELGTLRRYLQATQVRLNADVSNTREQAMKATRVMQALDNVQSCVMVADNNLDIIFMNKSVIDMFRNAEADIRTQLPNFDSNKLMGANIDQFHKQPSHQRNLLSGLNSSFSSSLVIGGRHMNIVANPVINDEGERIGTVVEWLDRTKEVKVEAEIEEIVESVKIGRLDKRLSLADKQGFFAKLSEGINELTDVIERVFKDVGSTMESMSEGDLTNRITSDYQGVYLNCKNDINATIDKLSEIFGQVNESAIFINNSSQEIASGNNNLSQRAEQQAANLEETAASMEELTSTVKNNADNAQQANLVASNARELAEKGGNVVTAAVAAMQEINESSNKIADIIGVIDEIAFQTNLLALNASVEAARAGEQGRGFSVVATEVRNLAQRSATAAKESKELIQSSVQKVRAGSEFVNQTGAALTEIVSGVKKVGDIVAAIADASVEQSAGIAQVNQAVSQMDEITQQNAALAEQASAASVSMSDLSTGMVELLSFFKLEGGNDRAVVGKPSHTRITATAEASKTNAIPATKQPSYKSAASDEEWQDF